MVFNLTTTVHVYYIQLYFPRMLRSSSRQPEAQSNDLNTHFRRKRHGSLSKGSDSSGLLFEGVAPYPKR